MNGYGTGYAEIVGRDGGGYGWHHDGFGMWWHPEHGYWSEPASGWGHDPYVTGARAYGAHSSAISHQRVAPAAPKPVGYAPAPRQAPSDASGWYASGGYEAGYAAGATPLTPEYSTFSQPAVKAVFDLREAWINFDRALHDALGQGIAPKGGHVHDIKAATQAAVIKLAPMIDSFTRGVSKPSMQEARRLTDRIASTNDGSLAINLAKRVYVTYGNSLYTAAVIGSGDWKDAWPPDPRYPGNVLHDAVYVASQPEPQGATATSGYATSGHTSGCAYCDAIARHGVESGYAAGSDAVRRLQYAVESSSLDPSFYLYPPLQIASALAHAYYGVQGATATSGYATGLAL